MNDEFMEEYTRIAEVFRTCCTNYGVEDRPLCDECPYSDLRKTVYSTDGLTPLYNDDSDCALALVNKVYEMLDELIIMVEQYNGWIPVPFSVIDKKTGKYPDLEKIALKEDWAQGLMYCDMEGFALDEDGTLLLLDECGRQVCCPPDRFEIVTEEESWND